MLESILRSLKYSSICNVLYLWSTRVILTYLFDKNMLHFSVCIVVNYVLSVTACIIILIVALFKECVCI